ncbi:ECF transporter S component [Pontibacillus sp. HMF3514]|uniref:ECF transporter S component n=1 Tax=Pontibacillus sp. HMF3514 TaxID=2692425 RepID=UPI00131FB836|nr:ECF transporter S component [Pontibacillus sp. HMF3514]QHE53377.1 ECF transporter S component [Pontibacillus sp. HMF3514]
MMKPRTGPSSQLLKLIVIALFGSISTVLMLLNFPLPMLPGFLKVDFSEVPALLAALLFSPLAGIAVELLKNILHLVLAGGEPVGAAANFVAGVLFILPVSLLYHKFKSVKSIVSGLATGTIIMAIALSILNYFVFLPLYSMFMGIDFGSETLKIVVAGILPFNVIKGIFISALFVPVFLKLKPWFDHKRLSTT